MVAALLLVCPGCIQGAGGNLELGLLVGLLFMMAAPFLVIGVIGGGLMRAKRRELTDEVERFLESERLASRTDAGQSEIIHRPGRGDR